MDPTETIKQKLAQQQANPEEQAKMDADIRAAKKSVRVRAMVNTVKAELAKGKSRAEIEAELPQEKAVCPPLFEMVCDPRHSPAMLYAMLAQLESVEEGRRSTHDASVAVGTILVNSFVRPKLGMEPVPLPN
jgi:hypothetical protein